MAVWHKASNNCWVAILILGLVTFSDLSDVTHVIQCVCVWSSLICVSVCVSVFILIEKNSKTYFGFLWLSISHSHDQLFDLTDEILTPAGCVLVMLVTSGYDMIYFALHLSQFIPDASLNINLNKQKQKTIFHKKICCLCLSLVCPSQEGSLWSSDCTGPSGAMSEVRFTVSSRIVSLFYPDVTHAVSLVRFCLSSRFMLLDRPTTSLLTCSVNVCPAFSPPTPTCRTPSSTFPRPSRCQTEKNHRHTRVRALSSSETQNSS